MADSSAVTFAAIEQVREALDEQYQDALNPCYPTAAVAALAALQALAEAAEDIHEAFMRSGDCRTYPLVPLYAALARVRAGT